MIKIALVEDNLFALDVLKEKLSGLEGLEVVHTAQNGQEMLDFLVSDREVDLIFMDIEMPVMDGIAATRLIKEAYPGIKIVMITIYDDDDFVFNAIQAGADSYILKETKADKIFETLQDTLNGGAVMSPSIALKTLQLLKASKHVLLTQNPTGGEAAGVALSEREIEILEQISKGYTNKRIAEHLIISPFTVKRHIENIYKKLQAHNRIDMLEKARKSGLI